MNSSKKPDSVYGGAAKELKKPSTFILGCRRISQLSSGREKFISVNYRRNKTPVYGPDTRVSLGRDHDERFKDLYDIQPRFLFYKIRFGQFQQTAPFWLHISL